MLGSRHIQVEVGRYIQHHSALKHAGEEIAFFRREAYLLYGDDVVKRESNQVLGESLRKSGVTFQSEIFGRPSTGKNFGGITTRIKESGTKVIAEIGGGRIINTTRAAGDVADVSTFTIPTSAATCAAYAILYVAYNEDDSIDHGGFPSHEIGGVVVDMDLIVNDCPRHYSMPNIVGAIAKKPGPSLTMAHLKNGGMIATSEIAIKIADSTYSKYMRDTGQALESFDNGKNSTLIDDMVNVSIMLTGMVSDLSTGDKQLAVVHDFYDAACCMYKGMKREYLHGETVAVALPLQLAVSRSPEAEIEEPKTFPRGVDIPVSIRRAGVPQDGLKELITYVHRVVIPDGIKFLRQIQDSFKYII